MREFPRFACASLIAATIALGCTPAAQPAPNDPSTTGETPESDPNAPVGGGEGGGGAGQGPFESSTGGDETTAPEGLSSPTPTAKPESCGGLELTPCPAGKKCVDDATDGCDPIKAGVSCPGVCMAK